MAYSLEKDGDPYEKVYYPKFIRDEFPSYETFWIRDIVPLTNRPTNIFLKSNSELAAIGKSEHDICISQLHYTVLLHLIRVYEIRQSGSIGFDQLIEGMMRLTGAQDVGTELLERFTNPNKYDPWGESIGKKARWAWEKRNRTPLQTIREYRNHLIHGRVTPIIITNTGMALCPAMGKVGDYLDWRKVMGQANSFPSFSKDYDSANAILDDAWKQTVQFFEQSWQDHLL